MRRFAKTLLAIVVLGSQLPFPARATDVRQLPWSQLLEVADAICRARLIAVVEEEKEGLSSGAVSLASLSRSTFRSVASMRGECPQEIEVQWTRGELLDLDEAGSSWILFLTSEGQASEPAAKRRWSLALPPRGAWKVETFERLSWSHDFLEAISPDSYLYVSGLPDALFSFEQLRVRYYSNLHLDFNARALRTDLLAAWLRNQTRRPNAAEDESSNPH